MTDEENKAIKDCDSIFIYLDDAMSEESANDYRKSYKILKNLIEKQSKEIEELNSDLEVFKRALTDLEVVYNKNYTSNDKIKAKVEDILNSENSEAIEKLIEWQSLLEKE